NYRKPNIFVVMHNSQPPSALLIQRGARAVPRLDRCQRDFCSLFVFGSSPAWENMSQTKREKAISFP
ncbi:MAG: hypothetical protein Q8P23_03670, partial [bacterium]|nr:hypothetical protein [bacterium]